MQNAKAVCLAAAEEEHLYRFVHPRCIKAQRMPVPFQFLQMFW